jgi:hypothetical protein
MTPTGACAAVVVSEEFAVTARQRVAAFLVTQPRAFCDACVARALGIDPSTAYRAAVKITRSHGFRRQYSACSECGDGRFVTCVSG